MGSFANGRKMDMPWIKGWKVVRLPLFVIQIVKLDLVFRKITSLNPEMAEFR